MGSKSSKRKSITGDALQPCSMKPMTGYMRDGYCYGGPGDTGKHHVCAVMDKQFLDYTASQGNDLRSVARSGDRWCLCEGRYMQAANAGKAPKVVKEATWSGVDSRVKKKIRALNG